MIKIMGIDYGTKRIGLALSDESRTFAREYRIMSPEEFWKQISDIISKEKVGDLVLGLPLNMSGERTEKTKEVEQFSLKLQKLLKLPIEFMDERLSSVMAGNLPGGGKNVDSLAAQIILQNYLDKTKRV